MGFIFKHGGLHPEIYMACGPVTVLAPRSKQMPNSFLVYYVRRRMW